MTNSEVSTLKRGDLLVEITSGVMYEITNDARINRSATHYEAWATSPRGAIVVRVSYSSGFERATTPTVIQGGLA